MSKAMRENNKEITGPVVAEWFKRFQEEQKPEVTEEQKEILKGISNSLKEIKHE